MSKLVFIVDSLDDIPRHLHEHYAPQEDGKFRLQVGDVVEKAKLDEFRETNIALNKERSALETAASSYRALGEDPVKLTEELDSLRKLKQRVDDKDLIDRTGFEKAVEQRVSEMKAAADGQIRALSDALKKTESEREESRSENRKILIHREITDASLASGARPDAIPDILARAERDGWTTNDRRRVILQRDGEIVFGENGVDPLSPKEWASRHLREAAPYFFDRGPGGNAMGSNVPGSTKNPWTKEYWNLTDQAAALKDSMAKGEMMAKAAGSFVGATRPAT